MKKDVLKPFSKYFDQLSGAAAPESWSKYTTGAKAWVRNGFDLEGRGVVQRSNMAPLSRSLPQSIRGETIFGRCFQLILSRVYITHMGMNNIYSGNLNTSPRLRFTKLFYRSCLY